jgi:hypothetical protein
MHKKGDKDNLPNHRPISIVPILGKIFETSIENQIYEYYYANNLFSSFQSGFCAGMSTI